MVSKNGNCSDCSHAPICAYKKQREALAQKLEYEAKLMENQQFTIRCDCKYFAVKEGIR